MKQLLTLISHSHYCISFACNNLLNRLCSWQCLYCKFHSVCGCRFALNPTRENHKLKGEIYNQAAISTFCRLCAQVSISLSNLNMSEEHVH